MSKDVQILARRIQLFIDSNDKDFIGQTYKTLYEWRHIYFRAANYIFTHFFLQDQVKELFYLTDETRSPKRFDFGIECFGRSVKRSEQII